MSTITTEFDTPAAEPIAVRPGARNVLALDLGTNCGFALSRDGKLTYGTKNFTARKGDGPGQRWLKFRALLADQYNSAGELHVIYYETVKRHVGVLAAHAYGAFESHLQVFCDVNRIRLVGVGVGTIKKNWTGNGSAGKDLMIAEARRRGFNVPIDADDTADALAILALATKLEAK